MALELSHLNYSFSCTMFPPPSGMVFFYFFLGCLLSCFFFLFYFLFNPKPLQCYKSLNILIHITNNIIVIILKEFLLEKPSLLTLHCRYIAVIPKSLSHHPSLILFPITSVLLYISFISLSCYPPLLWKTKQNKTKYFHRFSPSFAIYGYNTFIDF